MKPVFDPKTCPKRAQNEGPTRGVFVSGAAVDVTKSHRSELNRRPLLSGEWWFSGISGLFKKITRTIPAFLGGKVGKSHFETVPEPCLFSAGRHDPHTNPLLGFRFSRAAQMELERAAREELRQFAFRRGS